MPTLRPPKKGVSYSEALAAAYASAPEIEVVLDTLEFQHPAFLDDAGQPFAIRVVNDHTELVAKIEDYATLNPDEFVTFSPVYFSFSRPSETESGSLPEVAIQVDNVSRILTPYLDQAMESRLPITMIWRPYLASDLSGPHMNPVLSLTLRKVQCTMTSLSAQAGFTFLANRRFPGSEYTSDKFPGLTVR